MHSVQTQRLDLQSGLLCMPLHRFQHSCLCTPAGQTSTTQMNCVPRGAALSQESAGEVHGIGVVSFTSAYFGGCMAFKLTDLTTVPRLYSLGSRTNLHAVTQRNSADPPRCSMADTHTSSACRSKLKVGREGSETKFSHSTSEKNLLSLSQTMWLK